MYNTLILGGIIQNLSTILNFRLFIRKVFPPQGTRNLRVNFRVDFLGLKNLSRGKKSCFYGGLKNLFKKTFMCKISLEYKLKTKFSLKQVALQVELGEFRGNFGGVRKMFLKYLSVRCARKDTKLA